jgi:hypothetical protein
VLVVDEGARLIVYRRSLFRPRAVRVFEAAADGEIVIARPGGDVRVRCPSRFAVSVCGDYLRFSTMVGEERVALPWIAREDRDEPARRVGEMVGQGR